MLCQYSKKEIILRYGRLTPFHIDIFGGGKMVKNIEFASIDITYNCNLRCLHCYNSSGGIKSFREELSDQELLDVVEQIAEHKPVSFCICGGEPLLRKNLVYEIGKIIKSVSPKTTLNLVTNGFYVDKETAETLKKVGYYMVQVSLDGVQASSHNWMRNHEEAYNYATKALKLLVEQNLYVGLACIPTKKNFDEFENLLDYAHDIGVKSFRVQPLMLLGRADKNLKQEVLDEFDYFQLVEVLDRAKNKYKSMQIEWGDPVHHLEMYKDLTREIRYIQVNAYGDLLASAYLPIDFGNLKSHKLNDVLEADFYTVNRMPLVQKMLKYIVSPEDMNLKMFNKNIPEIGVDENIHLDLLDPNIHEIHNNYMKELFEVNVDENTTA